MRTREGFLVLSVMGLVLGGLGVNVGHASQTERYELSGSPNPPSVPGGVATKCSDSWFALSGVRQPQTSDGIGYSTNTHVLGSPLAANAEGAIENAFETWNSGVNSCALATVPALGFHKTGETDAPPSLLDERENGINEITFFDFSIVAGLNPTAVGIAWVNYDEVTQEVVEFDIGLDARRVWSSSGLGTGYDIQNAVTHLAGYAVGLLGTENLEHVNLAMFARTWPGDTSKRSLGLGDLLGRGAVL